MRLASVGGRATIVVGDMVADVERASGGRFGPELMPLFAAWPDFADFAATVSEGTALVADARFDNPVPAPRQVFGIFMNYLSHLAEVGMEVPTVPAAFTKWPASLAGPLSDIVIDQEQVDWEVELVVVIGRRTDRVGADSAWDHVAGFTVGQDISDRKLQFAAGSQFSLGKSRRGYGPIGPVVVSVDEFTDPSDLALACSIDGEVVQANRTSDMVFSIPQLIEFLSSVVPLLPGDLIFTGTPGGIGLTRTPPRFLAPGQMLESTIEGIGTMRNRCTAE